MKRQILIRLLLALALVFGPVAAQARYLNPNTGRFQTMDSYEGSQSDPLSLHKYLYCQADPVNRVDPSGNTDFIQTVATMGIQLTVQAISGFYSSGPAWIRTLGNFPRVRDYISSLPWEEQYRIGLEIWQHAMSSGGQISQQAVQHIILGQ